MWESRPPFGEISKGLVGRAGSLPFGFPRFPQPRHFHSSLLLAVEASGELGGGLRANGRLLRTGLFLLLAVL
jgi:hypothetical protein